MSDAIKHECGLAYIRLLKPLDFYRQKYGTAFFGLNKLCLLMEKQHNRGQDGAGIAAVKLNGVEGRPFMHRMRHAGQGAIARIFSEINQEVAELEKMYPGLSQRPELMKGYLKFMGEILVGHLRYGTQGKNNINFCHPFIKPNLMPSRHLAMAGNFNLINTEELFQLLETKPDNPVKESDLGAMIETMHHFLTLEDEKVPGHPDIAAVLRQATARFDGGYVFSGILGSGDSFVMRDANGIRPCYYLKSDEIVVAASERAAIMTVFNVPAEEVVTLGAGHAIIVGQKGEFQDVEILKSEKLTACSFERIYFSRGSDGDIYQERMQLGRNLSEEVLKAVDNDLKNTIVTFIPNTAEVAFYGLIKGLEDYLKEIKIRKILSKKDVMTEEEMRELIGRRVRIEKIAIKDVKIRTFITEDASRNEMVQHVYDITYGTVARGVDTLVIIDDSIVRGTTLRESVIKMLDRLGPKRVVVVSSAPQIRYPDCYGIDMSKMGDFIAFQAALELLKDSGRQHELVNIYDACLEAEAAGTLSDENFVKRIYDGFTPEQISKKIAQMLRADEVAAEVDVIYQTLDGLHDACPNNSGDWYFTGNYPTPGGNRVANRAFMNFMERKDGRGY